MTCAKKELLFQGSGVSPGIVLGHALRLDSRNRVLLKLYIGDDRMEEEVSRLGKAVAASKAQLGALKTRLAAKVGSEHSYIIDVHLLMLEDRSLISEIEATIRDTHSNAEWAIRQTTDRIRKAYVSIEDEYLRDRGVEIENVVERILSNLSGDKPFSWEDVPDDLIVVSHDFNPSSFAVMDLRKVRGLALESGGRTSHTAIISRSLRLPAVMGIREFLPEVNSGDLLLLNGDEGQLVVNPSPERLGAERERLERFLAAAEPSAPFGIPGTNTSEGVRVILRANTDLPHEVLAAKRCGAEGIGLFRTEFLFFAYPHGFPGIDAQTETYRMLAREMNPHPVSVRTLDTSGEMTAGSAVTMTPAGNSSMGLRGIRMSLMEKSAFCDQVEAVMLAGDCGRLEIVLPMVTTVDEIRKAKHLIETVRARVSPRLAKPGIPVPLGVMVEVPAAALAIESIAPEVDFVCVGTNDLIQYMLAVDRGNPLVSHLFQPLHPSILECLKRIAAACHDLKKPVRICGEISSNPFLAVLLIGIGFRDLSMNAFSIPLIRRIFQDLTLDEAREIAMRASAYASAREVAEYLIDAVSRIIRIDLSPYVGEIGVASEGETIAAV